MAKPKQKTSFETQIEGLTEIYNDTVEKVKKTEDAEQRKVLTQQTNELARQIRQVEEAQAWNKKVNKKKRILGIFPRRS